MPLVGIRNSGHQTPGIGGKVASKLRRMFHGDGFFVCGSGAVVCVGFEVAAGGGGDVDGFFGGAGAWGVVGLDAEDGS